MKKLTLSFLSFALLSISLNAQLLKQGQIAIGGSQSDQANSIVQTKDGGYAIAGYTSSFGPGSQAVYVTRFFKDGTVRWSKAIGGTGLDMAYSLVQSKDGGSAITGYTNSYAVGIEDVYVIKLDSDGAMKWSESIGGSAAEQGKCIINTRDGGYAIGGYTGSFGAGGPADMYVIKLTATGAIQWTKTIGGGGDEEAYTIIQAKDGGYALVGYTNGSGFGAGNSDVYIVKLDSTGALKWTKTFGGAIGDAGYGICQTSDKGYAVTGYTSNFGAGSNDVYVIKLDSTGATMWTKTIGGTKSEIGYSIIQTKDGGLAITGFTNSFGAGSNDVYLIKLDAAGNLKWDRAIGGAPSDYGNWIIQNKDGGYTIAGYTDSYGAGGDDCYIVVTDSLGNTCMNVESSGGTEGTGGTVKTGGTASSGGTINFKDSGRVVDALGTLDTICRVIGQGSGINEVAAALVEIKLYPNPSSQTIYLDFGDQSNFKNSTFTISIIDITGRILSASTLENPTSKIPFTISGLHSGIYFMQIVSDNGMEVKKFIKE